VLVAYGVVSAVHATPSNDIVIVPPANLPELARQGGDAMLLRESTDGRQLLYVEQENGSRLATFDVTDPGHIKAEGSIQLPSSGPFDFVSPLGKRTELIRFRRDQAGAMLDFHKDKFPNIETLEGLTVPGPVTTLGNDGFMVASQAADDLSPRDFQVVDAAHTRDISRAFDVKQVREEVTNADTGTTFLLAQGGLYEIRRPSVESDKKRREKDWFEQHTGG
jgi:hypothetical protein